MAVSISACPSSLEPRRARSFLAGDGDSAPVVLDAAACPRRSFSLFIVYSSLLSITIAPFNNKFVSHGTSFVTPKYRKARWAPLRRLALHLAQLL
jgi:hypothetical protein